MKLLHLLLLVLLLSAAGLASANTNNSYRMIKADTVALTSGSTFFGSSIGFKNRTLTDVTIYCAIQVPKKWRSISPKVQSFTLKATEQQQLIVNLLMPTDQSAGVDSIPIKVWDSKGTDTALVYIIYSLKPAPSFVVNTVDGSQFYVDGKPEDVQLKFNIKNTGNVRDTYIFSCDNVFLGLNSSVSLELNPGQDTIVQFTAPINKRKWSELNTEQISVKYESALVDKQAYTYFNISRPVSTFSEVRDLNNVLPLTLGGGILALGDQITYYGQVQASYSNGNHSFYGNYKSKEFGQQANQFQRNSFFVQYKYKLLTFEAGEVKNPKNFQGIGQGGAISIGSPNRLYVKVAGLKHRELPGDYRFRNDNGYAVFEYKIRKANVEQRLETNFDTYYKINSYIQQNEIALIKRKRTLLNLFGAVSYEDAAGKPVAFTDRNLGYGIGGLFAWSNKDFVLNSTIRIFSGNFPGIFKGSQTQAYQAIYNINKHIGIGLSYTKNVTTQNRLVDTIYNSDFLGLNNTKFGIVVVKSGTIFKSRFGAGIIQDKGFSSGFGHGSYANLQIDISDGGYRAINFSTANAFAQEQGHLYNATNTMLVLNTKHFGLFGSYNKIPQSMDSNGARTFTETIFGGPNVNFSAFRNTLNGNIRLNVSKNTAEDQLRPGIGAQIGYRPKKGGLSLMLNGYYPFKDPTVRNATLFESRYGSLTITKTINISLKKRDTRNLDVLLYNDANHNNMKDSTEEVLSNAIVVFDGKPLVTNEEGKFYYKRAKPGMYNFDLSNAGKNGLVPQNGFTQSVAVSDSTNKSIEIPFKLGKSIRGSVTIERDSFSTTHMTSAGLKIIVSDSSNRKYFALTNPNGQFELFLPEGIYTVSLNPEAFINSPFKPHQMTYKVNLYKEDTADVKFVIEQKKRVIKFREFK